MKYLIDYSQLAHFIRRRFSIEDLNKLIEDLSSNITFVYDLIETNEFYNNEIEKYINKYSIVKRTDFISDEKKSLVYFGKISFSLLTTWIPFIFCPLELVLI
jgi:hypothetical protein